MSGVEYTKAEAENIKELYLGGDTFSEMAKKTGRSRCSIIGYCTRQVQKGNLPVRDNAKLNAEMIKRRREKRVAEKTAMRRVLQNPKAYAETMDSPNKINVGGRPISMFTAMITETTPALHELKGCAFPFDHRWCNKKRGSGSYYCEEHQNIVYNRKAINE